MKKIKFSLLIVLSTVITMSFVPDPITTAELVSTKWISPINDNCFDSLCFTSDKTVMYYQCAQNAYFEIGYKISGDKIEIEAYNKAPMDAGSKMILVLDNGILKQPKSKNNPTSKNFIIVPDGVCN
jgi:hypothetical protein